MLSRRTLWDLPWERDFLALEPEQRAIAVHGLAASDEQFQRLAPQVQEFTISELLVPVSLNRWKRFLRALRVFGRRLLWIGEGWSERQRREQTEAAREFALAVVERNTEGSQTPKTGGLDAHSRLESEGATQGNSTGERHENGKAAVAAAADDPTTELLDPINVGDATVN